MDHFAGAIAAHRDPKTPGEEGRRDVRIITAIYRSPREGQPVSLESTSSIMP
jgi:predicted dehydrogenase